MTKAILICLYLLFAADVLALDADNMNELYRQAEAYYAQGNYREAINKFEEVLKIYPDHSFAKKYIKEAENKFRSTPLIERNEARNEDERQKQEEMNKIFRDAEALYKKEKYRESIRELQKILIKHPDHTVALEEIKKTERKMHLDKIAKKRQAKQGKAWAKEDLQELKKEDRLKLEAQNRIFEELEIKRTKELERAKKMEEEIKAQIHRAEERARQIQEAGQFQFKPRKKY